MSLELQEEIEPKDVNLGAINIYEVLRPRSGWDYLESVARERQLNIEFLREANM